MKKNTLLFITILLISTLILYYFNNNIVSNKTTITSKDIINLTQEEKIFLKTHHKITVHMEDNYIPFSDININGEFVGYSIDYANIIAHKLGIKFIYNKNENWNEAIANLKDKKIDIIGQAINTKSRQRFALFSKEYMRYHQAIVVKKKNIHLFTLDKLKGKRVGIVEGYNSEKVISKNYPQIKLIGFSDNETLLNAILLNKVDAGLSTHQVMQYNINNMFLKNIISIPILNNPYLPKSTEAFAIRNDYPLLHSAIEKAFQLISDKEITKIELKWFGQSSQKMTSKIQLTLKEQEYLENKKVIKICVDPNWMPFEKIKDGKHIGLSAEYMQIFSDKLSTKTRLIPTKTWRESLNKARKRECDLLPLAVNTKKRSKYLKFTTPYITTPVVVATRVGTVFVNDIEQVLDKKLAVVKGYFLFNRLKTEYPNINLVEVNSIQDGLEKVQKGEIFGYLDNSIVLNNEIQKNYIGIINISGKFKHKFELAIATRNDEPLLNQIFQKAIKSTDEVTKEKISNHWITVQNKEVLDYQLLWQIMIVVLIIIVFGVYRDRLLKNQNQKLEKIIHKKTKDLQNLNKSLENKVEEKTKDLQDSICVFEALLDTALEGILIFDENNICIEANKMALEIYHTNNESDLIGDKLTNMVNKETLSIIKQHLLENYLEPYEVNLLRKNGEEYPALVKGKTTVLKGKRVRVSAILDMTDIKHKENALRLAKQKAEESTQIKSEFLANMSHEIRTPMNGIIGMTHLAIKSNKDNKQEKYLNTINNSANALLSIINDILDFSKIEAGKLEINKIDFNLKELLRQLSNSVKFKANEKGLRFRISYDNSLNIFLHADNLRIQQILINLVNNAIKFTSSGYVKISIENNQDTLYTFKVEDSGIGMNQDTVDNLFQAFSQADGSTTRKYGGTGLGLSISKQLVELMDGKIWVESQEDKGSTFYFSLNIENAKKEIRIAQYNKITLNDISTLKSSKILLTEDNQTNQELIIGLLENSGINIDIASNGKEAVDKVKENPTKYELILMDIQMPIMDGYKATEIIRTIDKNIPIIALTANAMKEDRERTKQAGMNEHLNKPIEVDKLYRTLLKHISQKVDSSTNMIGNKLDIEIPNFKNIDIELGLSLMANNKKLYIKILKDFYKNNKELKLECLDDKELERVAHTIKGLSANIGAKALSEISAKVELTLNRALFDKFYKELNLVLEELDRVLITDEKSISMQNEISPKLRDKLFKELKEAVLSKRAKNCKLIIEEIDNYVLSNEDKETFTKIKDLVSKYKFKDAITIIS